MLTVPVAAFCAATLLTMRPSSTVAAPPEGGAPADTTIVVVEEHHDHHYSMHYAWRHARPMIGIQYGFGDVDRDGFGGELAPVGALDVQLGYRAERRFGGEDALLHQSTHYAHVGNLASRLASDSPGPSEVGTDMWRFGGGFGDGYGYRFASQRGRFILQSSGTIAWYTLELEGEAAGGLSPVDAVSLEQFTSHTRFGESWESAFEVGFGDMLALHAGYELTAVFPSFKIWYWLLSTGIDRGALIAVGMFVDEVEDASPFAAPIVRFLLEGALQYGFYELRNEEVNWPFETEAPLAYDLFKLGLTTRF
ncbi:MAG TPA: hypothetical protein VFN38_11980 [Gemmatimonadaceae bacterium]|nr:hypothetical protein [Gemmatimonadaceae bacterium]